MAKVLTGGNGGPSPRDWRFATARVRMIHNALRAGDCERALSDLVSAGGSVAMAETKCDRLPRGSRGRCLARAGRIRKTIERQKKAFRGRCLRKGA